MDRLIPLLDDLDDLLGLACGFLTARHLLAGLLVALVVVLVAVRAPLVLGGLSVLLALPLVELLLVAVRAAFVRLLPGTGWATSLASSD